MAYRVLVVEDRIAQREAIVALLVLEGYEVMEARDGEEGVSRTLEDRPDVIVADFRMPRMDAAQMARAIRDGRREPPIPIVVITSLEPGRECKKMLRDEKLFRIVLRKPVDPHELLEEVRAATAERSGNL